ncbi:very low-density lipoprotein receptor-like [Mercenaria mercenaria]|uniref:very low-density lipoprotein receptor-like n=1 Tax=Mercenaria mercenaria TaxID=6596 RepID=UPI00234ED330|nr:very low-density lipoprotein receptor-like [Mercenaria mercenaria]
MIKTNSGTNFSSNVNNPFVPTFELSSYFRCATLEWISIIAKCDGVIDCFDASDEIGCYSENIGNHVCSKEQFQCADGDCIHISLVCNFRDDCKDWSDEFCEFEQCSPMTEYRCNNGQCIPTEQRCNAVQQCADGSDELACGLYYCVGIGSMNL